jgi:AraC family transcriptional regulator, ethanolamine operon transcriptional activator
MISMGSLSRRAPADGWARSVMIDPTQLGSMVRQDLSFHDYVRKVSIPGVDLMLAKPGRGDWHVASRVLRRMTVQAGSTRGATVTDGVSRSDLFVFVMRGPGDALPMSLNGQAMTGNDVVVLPPGRHFVLTSKGPCKWMSLSVTPGALAEAGFTQAQICALGAVASLICLPRALARQLADAATDLVNPGQDGSDASCMDQPDESERALLEDLFTAIDGSDTTTGSAEYGRIDSLDRIGRRALALLRTEEGLDLHVEDLCRATKVAERSLLRAFHKLFGIGPTQYIKLRRLNKVHHELQVCDCKETTVTEAMTDCGVTEFGRFAGAYKALFGECPSETLRRKLERAARVRAGSDPGRARPCSGAACIGADIIGMGPLRTIGPA